MGGKVSGWGAGVGGGEQVAGRLSEGGEEQGGGMGQVSKWVGRRVVVLDA